MSGQAAPTAHPTPRRRDRPMRELLRSNDVVLLSWLDALLRDAGIACVLLDVHTSVLEGSIGAIPRRLMVEAADFPAAVRLLREAGHAVG